MQIEHTCENCRYGEWRRKGWDITMMDEECGGCTDSKEKWKPKEGDRMPSTDAGKVVKEKMVSVYPAWFVSCSEPLEDDELKMVMDPIISDSKIASQYHGWDIYGNKTSYILVPMETNRIMKESGMLSGHESKERGAEGRPAGQEPLKGGHAGRGLDG